MNASAYVVAIQRWWIRAILRSNEEHLTK